MFFVTSFTISNWLKKYYSMTDWLPMWFLKELNVSKIKQYTILISYVFLRINHVRNIIIKFILMYIIVLRLMLYNVQGVPKKRPLGIIQDILDSISQNFFWNKKLFVYPRQKNVAVSSIFAKLLIAARDV